MVRIANGEDLSKVIGLGQTKYFTKHKFCIVSPILVLHDIRVYHSMTMCRVYMTKVNLR